MAVLLSLAAIGGAIRHWADNPSLLRDIGTLMLVLWLPAVGNLVAFVIRRIPRRAGRPAGFAAGSAFLPHLRADLTPIANDTVQPVAALEQGCTLLLGQAGYTARAASPLSQWLAAGRPQTLELQLLRPALALPQLAPGTAFDLLVGNSIVGHGRVSAPAAGLRAAANDA
ncbi:MAG: hypothetical protein JWP43_3287 [Ramlibacter sp.]|nr:hypothetical protein [Ramlibacter sp.]